MPIFDETWDENDYAYRNRVNLKTLPKNHLQKLTQIKFDFIEYKANQLLSCHIYERMMIHCMNQYGLMHDSYRPECLDATTLFHTCIELNAGYGLQKKYFPESFLGNPYSRPTPHFKDLAFPVNFEIFLGLTAYEKAMVASPYKQKVRLVAVSKTKPIEAIMEAYEAGMRHFGENYVDEIVEKSKLAPADVKWHFIGHLQSNKVKQVITPNLHVLETVDSIKLAEKVQKCCEKIKLESLNVYVQVKTSEEETKFGTNKEESLSIIEYVLKSCPNLKFLGLMTIGAEGDLSAFTKLRDLRDEIGKKFAIDPTGLDLSMGMSGDYETAILEGSTSVRIGSSIFGQRDYSKKK